MSRLHGNYKQDIEDECNPKIGKKLKKKKKSWEVKIPAQGKKIIEPNIINYVCLFVLDSN